MDNGSELLDDEFRKLLKDHGVIIQLSTPYTPEQNGLAERTNRIIMEKARCWMEAAQAPQSFWPYFYEAAVNITNFTVNSKTKHLKPSPWEAAMNELKQNRDHKPDLTNAFTPGTKIIAHIPQERRQQGDKQALRGEEGMLLNWVFNDPSKPWKIFRCHLPERSGTAQQQIVQFSSLTIYEVVGMETCELALNSDPSIIIDSISVGNPQQPPTQVQRFEAPASGRKNSRKVTTAPTAPKGTRSSARLATANLATVHETGVTESGHSDTVGTELRDPVTLGQALEGPDAARWREGTYKEMRNLLRQRVFRAVPRHTIKNSRPLTMKIVFKTKKDKDGNTSEYKARVVIRGFEQRYGVDYLETYAAVAKSLT